MNENLIYIFIVFVAYIAYKKYNQYKVVKQIPSLLEKGGQIVDVRTVEEFKMSHVDKSINIPLDVFKSRIKELDNTKPIIVCCASGSRSALARRILLSSGFEDVYNAGSWRALRK